MDYIFRKDTKFNRQFRKLSISDQELAKEKFKIFRINPFDPKLGTHKIAKLSAAYKQTVYAVVIRGDLRSTFLMKGNIIWSLDIGSHFIYESLEQENSI